MDKLLQHFDERLAVKEEFILVRDIFDYRRMPMSSNQFTLLEKWGDKSVDALVTKRFPGLKDRVFKIKCQSLGVRTCAVCCVLCAYVCLCTPKRHP